MKNILIIWFIALCLVFMVGYRVESIKQNYLQASNDLLQQQYDSLLTEAIKKDTVISLYHQHLSECAFVSRHQIRRITGRNIELYPNYTVPHMYKGCFDLSTQRKSSQNKHQ